MHDAHEFLKAITIVLCVAAITIVVFQRLKQPVVLGYIIAGLIVGPHIPIPLVANRQVIQTLSELGVILLMFSLGLEFSIQKLLRVGITAGITAMVQSSFMIWLGYIIGQALGWTALESLFAGSIIAISSTTIIAKAFDERGIQGRLRELVVGILVVEDLIAIVLMAFLTALSSGQGSSLGALLRSGGRLMVFLIGLALVGLLIIPRMMRAINRLKRAETTLVATIGICFAVALIAQEFGYSVALGAFIAGSLVAESGEEKVIEPLVMPVRDMFAAIFFVSVGMLIDPALIAQHWVAVTVLTLVVIIGKVLGVSVGAFLTGNGTRTSIEAGMSLAQIGEFSFIIASLGIATNATRDFMYPVAVAVSAITTLTTPWLIRFAGPVASYVDRKLPPELQTFAALYGNWIERMRAAPHEKTVMRARSRLVRMLAFDGVLLGTLIIGAAGFAPEIANYASEELGLPHELALTLVVPLAIVLAFPFIISVFRIVRTMGVALAITAIPDAVDGFTDVDMAPRRALVVTLQLSMVLLLGLPLLAVTQPFLPLWAAAASFGALLLLLGLIFWRSATRLQGHVRAGAELLAEAFSSQLLKGPRASHEEQQIRRMLPGLGEPVPLLLEEGSRGVGQTLAQLDLRGRTGASVLVIARGDKTVIVPTANEVLRPGDVLALAGSHDAVVAATQLLKGC